MSRHATTALSFLVLVTVVGELQANQTDLTSNDVMSENDVTNISATTSPSVVTILPILTEGNCDGRFPCEEDQFCSKQWKRCRSCNDIVERCSDMDTIHTSYPTCEQFCIRTMLEEAARVCTEEKSVYQQKIQELNRGVNQLNSSLNKATQEAGDDRMKCALEKEKAAQNLADQDQSVNLLNNSLAKERAAVKICSKELTACEDDRANLTTTLTAIIVLAVALGLCLIGAVVTIVVLWKRVSALQTLTRNNGRHDPDRERLIVRQECGKPPVQAERRSTNLGFSDHVVPNGARTPTYIRRDIVNTPLQ